MKTKILAILALAGSIVSCSGYLERPPYDKVENSPEFYNSENNVRSTVNGWYDIYFTGYETGWTRSDFFDGTDRANWCDDLAQESATYFTTVAPSTSTNWSFANVRRINLLFEGVTASRAITISAFDMPISSAISVIDGSLRFFFISVSRVVIAL